MNKRSRSALMAAITGLFFSVAWCANSYAFDKDLTAEEVVSRHLSSIGSAETRAAIKSRAVKGVASIKFIQRAIGDLSDGKALIVSEGRQLAMVMNFGTISYPGEHFAFNGQDVTVGYIDFDVRSPLGSFVNLFRGLIKEGLWGGTLSTAWPLLDIKGRMPTLRCKKRRIDRKEVYVVNYSPKSRVGSNDVRIELFFDTKNFHHIRTEYKYPYTTYSLRVTERFENFQTVDGLTLPRIYGVEYSAFGGGRGFSGTEAFLGYWTIEAKEILHNVPIDPELFVAQDPAQWRVK